MNYDKRREEGLVRKLGWAVVGLGSLGAAVGYYVACNADFRAGGANLGLGVAAAGVSLAIVGLLLIQVRS